MTPNGVHRAVHSRQAKEPVVPPPAHTRVTLSGIFGTAVDTFEIWAMNISLAAFAGISQANQLQLANAVVGNYATNLMPRVEPVVRLTRVRVAAVAGDGKVVKASDGSFFQADNTNGGAQVASVTPPTRPYQVSCALGLRSAAAGPTGRGRVFLPLPTGALDVSGRFSDATRDAHLLAWKAFVDRLNTDAAALQLGRVCIASGGSVTKGIAPALRPVVRVECGVRPDIQRRRANDLPELYETLDVA